MNIHVQQIKARIVRLKIPFISTRLKYRDASQLPEYVYAGKNIKPHTRVYVMGVTTHGALGIRYLVRPTNRSKIFEKVQYPLRLIFADVEGVNEVSCGYGFTVLSLKRKSTEAPLFLGTGVATSCQIGYHSQRKGHPIELIIEPSPINIPLSKPCKAKKIACGRAHTMLWTDSEGLWTFGNNSFGQCGRPIVKNECDLTAVRYKNISFFHNKIIDQIECGQDTSFVLSNGKLYSSGWSADGQTGRGTYENVEKFEEVGDDLKGENVVKVSCKGDCVLALTDKGDVFGWGNSEYRQLGSVTEELQINTPKLLKLKGIEGKIVDVAATGTSCHVITDSGDVWSWGYGALGLGPNVTSSLVPQRIPGTLLGRNVLNKESKVQKIFAGVTFVAAVTNSGGLYTWGRNPGGCLGLGHTNFQYFPMRVCIASSAYKVSCGVDHMVVMAKSLM